MKQRVVDSVTIEAANLVNNPGCWVDITEGDDHLLAIGNKGNILEVDCDTLAVLRSRPAVFQTCSECKKKIDHCYRVVRHRELEVAFVRCSCGSYPAVARGDRLLNRLTVQFDSTAIDNSGDHYYNRSVWSTSTALLYCEKTSRLVVEYQWKDLEAGQFDKHSVKHSGIASNSKTADIVVEGKEGSSISFLLRDGKIALDKIQSRINGKI